MFCPQCGNEVPEGGLFCPKCGAQAGAPAPGRVPPPMPPSYPPHQYGKPQASAEEVLQRPAGVTILAILNFLGGALYLIGGIALLALGARGTQDDVVGPIVVGVIFLLLGALALICGRGLWTLQPYGRIIQLVFSWIGLIGFPLGTIISIVILVYLYKPQMKLLFSGKTPQQLTPDEIGVLARYAQSGAGGAGLVVGIVVALFVVVAMIGMIAAIAIPNLLNAIQRGKQKRTMADIRAIGTACESYAVDNSAYPDAESMEDLASYVEPKYIRTLPRTDGWTNPIHYAAWSEEENEYGPDTYIIVSTGKDGVLEYEDLDGYSETATQDFNNDIVFSVGAFVQYPEGAQQ